MSQAPRLRLRRSRFDWARFDALPTYVKEVTWEFGCHWTGKDAPSREFVAAQREKLEAKRRELCRETYGGDHPDAEPRFSDADFFA